MAVFMDARGAHLALPGIKDVRSAAGRMQPGLRLLLHHMRIARNGLMILKNVDGNVLAPSKT